MDDATGATTEKVDALEWADWLNEEEKKQPMRGFAMAAQVIRNQADEIERLRTAAQFFNDAYRSEEAKVERLRDGLQELREELNTMEADPKMLNRIIREALHE